MRLGLNVNSLLLHALIVATDRLCVSAERSAVIPGDFARLIQTAAGGGGGRRLFGERCAG